MLFFIQYNDEETSTFSDYYIEMISHYFSDDFTTEERWMWQFSY